MSKWNCYHQLLPMRKRSLGWLQSRLSKRMRRKLEREGILYNGMIKMNSDRN